MTVIYSDAPEPTFWRAEPSRAFYLASRAEPSFGLPKNEPNTSLKIFDANNILVGLIFFPVFLKTVGR